MFDTSARSLKILAAVLWVSGGLVLLLKGGSLLWQAVDLRQGLAWPALAVISALLIGSLKVRFIFSNSCRKNLRRIEALPTPRWWQFYRPGFLLFLCAMIVLGRYLSISAQGSYAGLLGMATLDLSLATALLGSSYVFWQTNEQTLSQ